MDHEDAKSSIALGSSSIYAIKIMHLHDVVAAKDQVMVRWRAQVRGTLAPESMPSLELADRLPKFIDEIATALRDDVCTRYPAPDQSSTAAEHGVQRLRLGFSLDAVVREYGALRHAILAAADAAGVEPTFRELQILFDWIIMGIASAVAEYTHQRDAELVRQANEHFAFISHELRNPLTAAAVALHQLEAKGVLPKDHRGVIALGRGLQRATELIEQTLNVARIASGIELRREWTTLGAIFEDVEVGAISEAEAKKVELRTALQHDQPIHVDLRLLRSAIVNLIRNAIKYTRNGTRVELRGSIANGRITVEVEDRCGGLEPGKVETAFAPFVRIDRQESGFGLGLAIARQAVDAHRGSIRVQNLPQEGCIFVLELPATEKDGPSVDPCRGTTQV